ncbi:MAG TPA: tRNA lysidine(34) synthetase TilS [Acidobacteriaceae bacterium]|nr:tRNA lysidine(34) synthetase TilS [Acidobacteriaceae bacterium]
MTNERRLAIDLSLMNAGERVCVAVSGGADSTALLLALIDANRAKEGLGAALSAVHVHHGLRGVEADGDEAFVRDLCARLEVPLVVERVDVAARQSEEREGLEEAARELRYGVFWRLMADVDVVATAHTLDDQAETVVMKLLRGAWTEGVGGIAPTIERPMYRDLKLAGSRRIVRPMLGVRRLEVEAYLQERGQAWREDETNRDLSLTRNRVRHELMPMLRTFNPAIDATLARLAEIARDEEAFWKSEVARVLPQVLLPGRPVRGGGRAVSTVTGNSGCAIEVERLRAMAPALRRRVVREAARSLGCSLSAEETSKLLALAGLAQVHPPIAARTGARLELSRGLRAERTAREIQLQREAAPFVAKTTGRKAGGEAAARG